MNFHRGEEPSNTILLKKHGFELCFLHVANPPNVAKSKLIVFTGYRVHEEQEEGKQFLSTHVPTILFKLALG